MDLYISKSNKSVTSLFEDKGKKVKPDLELLPGFNTLFPAAPVRNKPW